MSQSSTPAASDAIYDASSLGRPRMFLLGLQHLFAMFGATVLVPVLTGLSVSATLCLPAWARCCSTSCRAVRCRHFGLIVCLYCRLCRNRVTARPSFCLTPAWA
ncbi:MAG: solute carrier family 23 protein [Collinsella sp.]